MFGMMISSFHSRAFICLSKIVLVVFLLATPITMYASAAAPTRSTNKLKQQDITIDNLNNYAKFPRRSEEEACVLEWGHSAIISALDASVAHFGPQTSQAALLEVETMPILASPLNGLREGEEYQEDEIEGEEEGEEEGADADADADVDADTNANNKKKQKKKTTIIRPLDNAEDVHGNMVVMTNTGPLSGLQMAKIAKASGAAALLIVNIDEKRPDDIYRLGLEENEERDDAEDIDIPVVMISMNSANVLTSATVTPEMAPEEIINHGMPDRVRLYAGGDRPFFEDVEPAAPTLYLIHNLLTGEECDALIDAADPRVTPIVADDVLQMTYSAEDFEGIQRVMLWQGLLQSPVKKAIEERIEQVTGFPETHYSDFIIDKLESGAQWKPRYDAREGLVPPMASITIFLSNESGPLVYPKAKEPVQIVAHKGVAVVHHNTNERNRLDKTTLHALLPPSSDSGPVYIARKYVYATPVSTSRRVALPIFAAPFGGRLPDVIVKLHDLLVEQFGPDTGGLYFDKICVFVPLLILLIIAQAIGFAVHRKMTEKSAAAAAAAASSAASPSKSKTTKKRKEKKSD